MSNTSKIIKRLSKIEGQIRGIKLMIEAGRDFEDILTQLSAVKSGINQAALELLFGDNQIGDGDQKDKLKKIMSKFI